MLNKRILLTGVVIPAVLISFYFLFAPVAGSSRTMVTVARVIDGDTFELGNGKSVRLLGIDAPERGMSGYDDAKGKLKEMVMGKEVGLEKDIDNTDKVGRLLRYVYVGDVFVNSELVRQGYADAYIVQPDVKYQIEMMKAEDEAKSNQSGIWKRSEFSECLSVSNFHYNAKGDDSKNMNDEFVILRNGCNYPIDLDGWKIKDKTFNIYSFSGMEIAGNSEVKVNSGAGKDTGLEVFWNNTYPVWDNSGDTIFIRDNSGSLVMASTY